jgi:beta-N-acetylhexosaminidase
MKALQGAPADLAACALAAGADVALHCNGELEEMQQIAAALKPMNDESWARWNYAKSSVRTPEGFYDPVPDSERLDTLLGGLAYEVNEAKAVG